MKTNFKRLFALLLTVCMLASLMVPVAFAEDVAVDTPSANVAETYPIRLKDLNHTDPTTAEGLDKLLVKTNKEGVTSYYGPLLTDSVITDAYAAKTLNWKGFAYTTSLNDAGNLVNHATFRDDMLFQVRLQSGWNALVIRVSEPGSYALNFTTDKTVDEETEKTYWTNECSDWAGDVTAYAIPLNVVNEAVANAVIPEAVEGELQLTAEQVAIESLMTEKYCVGTATMGAADTDVTFDKVRMDYDEYVIVYTASEGIYTICEMSLIGEAYEKNEVATYDFFPFDLEDDLSTWANHTYNKNLIQSSTTDDATGVTTYVLQLGSNVSANAYNGTYESFGWKYLAHTGAYQFCSRTAYQLYIKDANAWAAVQLNVPQTGNMYLSLTTNKGAVPENLSTVKNNKNEAIYNSCAQTPNVTAYIIPVAALNGDAAANIPTLIADDTYCVGTKAMLAEESTVTFDKAFLKAGEYAVVYKADQASYAISEMKLEQLACDVITENDCSASQTITTALQEISDPVFDQIVEKETSFATELNDGNGGTTTLRAYTDAQYAAGALDWKVEAYSDIFSDSTALFNNKGGLALYTPAGSAGGWIALRIRVTSGGSYNISINAPYGYNDWKSVYMFPASSEAMAVEDIQALMTPENGLFYNPGRGTSNQKISAGYLGGEYIMVLHTSLAKKNIFLHDIVLEPETFGAEDAEVYDFNIFNESNPYYNIISNLYTTKTEDVTDETTGETTSVTSIVPLETIPASINCRNKYSVFIPTAWDEAGNPTTLGYLQDAIYKADGSGYPYTLNWRPDAAYKSNTATDNTNTSMTTYTFYDLDHADNTKASASNAGVKDANGSVASFMLHVDKAGTYKLAVKGGYYDVSADIYFIDAFSTDYKNATTHADVKSYINAETPVNKGVVISKRATAVSTEIGEVTVDAAGDFLVVFDLTNANLGIDGITLTPVVEEAPAAIVGGETYATFGEALADAEPGETIHLLDTVVADAIEVPAGVTLNLNGQAVYADSLDAVGDVIDMFDGQAALYVDEVVFEVDNPQLPLKDKAAGAYHLYNVDVEPVTITGKNSASPKYWFQIKFSNKAALDLIGMSTELRIQAALAVDGVDAFAYADAAFSASWADKYAANDGVYITVSAINGADAESFTLAPQVAANGVVISGADM